jgi:hypothetical protein
MTKALRLIELFAKKDNYTPCGNFVFGLLTMPMLLRSNLMISEISKIEQDLNFRGQGFVARSSLSGHNFEEGHDDESLSEQFLPWCTFL